MFDFRRITRFYLEKRLIKHKMTLHFLKILGGHGPPWLRLWTSLPDYVACKVPAFSWKQQKCNLATLAEEWMQQTLLLLGTMRAIQTRTDPSSFFTKSSLCIINRLKQLTLHVLCRLSGWKLRTRVPRHQYFSKQLPLWATVGFGGIFRNAALWRGICE